MDAFLSATGHILTPVPLLWCMLGVTLGIVVGAIPGLSGSMLITMTVPLTFFMGNYYDALILLVAMYVGSISGGLVSATLLRMPGTPAAIMTTLDGYPMAQKGHAGRALGFGIMASFIGGLISWVFLITLSPTLAVWATYFGPWEYFTMVLMALVLIASLSSGSLVKGLLSGFLGMLASMPGVDNSTGMLRLTFGFDSWAGGFTLLPVLLGVFVVSQVLKYVIDAERPVTRITASNRGIFMTLGDLKRQAFNLVRSSVIGTWIGILPGIGASIGSICAYTAAKNMSKTPEKFGTGYEDGIVASESANNATIGGALVPLVTMGIPGSVIDAILIGALLMHNLQPGPLLFVTDPEVPYTIISTHLIANLLMFAIMLLSVKWISKLILVPTAYLMPLILMFCLVGAFSLQNRVFDVWVTLAFGVVGFVLERIKVPLAPFVIGFILASLAESELRSGLMASAGSIEPLFTRPIAASFLAVSAFMLVWSMRSEWRQARARKNEGKA
ncbi:MAG: tripartite tricarboxylate transporter permease [Acuticoccus sp.]